MFDYCVLSQVQTVSTDAGIVTLLNAFLAVAISAIVSWLVTRYQLRSGKEQALERQVDELLQIILHYPHLDSDTFVEKWTKGEGSFDERERYAAFCCFAFNLLYRVWKFHHGDAAKIDEMILAREIVHRHKGWWLADSFNEHAYSKKFCVYVNSFE